MQDGELNPNIVAFIRRYIRSVEQLEILLLVSSPPIRTWTPAQVYDIIKSNVTSVYQRLRELSLDGLLTAADEREPVYRYEPNQHELVQAVAELTVLYKERRLRVLEIIYPGTDKGQDFADAFRFRRKS